MICCGASCGGRVVPENLPGRLQRSESAASGCRDLDLATGVANGPRALLAAPLGGKRQIRCGHACSGTDTPGDQDEPPFLRGTPGSCLGICWPNRLHCYVSHTEQELRVYRGAVSSASWESMCFTWQSTANGHRSECVCLCACACLYVRVFVCVVGASSRTGLVLPETLLTLGLSIPQLG